MSAPRFQTLDTLQFTHGQIVRYNETTGRFEAVNAGEAGAASVIRSGEGAPDNAVGQDGDFWISEDTGAFYKRIAGEYEITAYLFATQAALDAEIAARTAADTANATAITNEATTRAAADTTNATAITTETAARIAADAEKADLVGGKVPAAQMPASYDDVQEEANLAAFPATGESNKIYVAADTNFEYRWNGSSYTGLNEGVVLGETSSTAYRGDRGKEAWDHSQETDANPHNTSLLQLPDTPSSYTGQGEKVIAVKADESGVEFIAPPAGGRLPASRTVTTTPITHVVGDDVIIANSASAQVLNLVAGASATGLLRFKKIGAGTLTVVPNGSETIDGAADLTVVDQWKSFTLMPYAGGWYVVD